MFHRLTLVTVLMISNVFLLNAKIIDNVGVSFGGGQSFEIGYDFNK